MKMKEKDLVRRCIARDQRAWKEFLARYSSCIYGTIYRILNKYSITEPEIAADVFAQVIEKLLADDCAALRRFSWKSRLSTWLVSITRNKTYDYLRGRMRKPTISLYTPIGEDEELEKILHDGLDLEHTLTVNMTVHEILELLAPKDRLVLKLYYIEGMKEKEIADLLKTTVDAVSARKSRALQKIRNLVEKPGE